LLNDFQKSNIENLVFKKKYVVSLLNTFRARLGMILGESFSYKIPL